MPVSDDFNTFMENLAADLRVRRMVTTGLLPAQFATMPPDVAILTVTMQLANLADARDRGAGGARH